MHQAPFIDLFSSGLTGFTRHLFRGIRAMRTLIQGGIFTICMLLAMTSWAAGKDASALHTAKIPMISVIAPDWEDYTSPNGEGLYWDVIREIYEPEGIKVRINTAPWRRAMKMVTKYRLHHAIPGEYRDTEENLIFPRYPIDLELMVTVTLKQHTDLNPRELSDYRGHVVSWRKGYDLLVPEEYGFELKEFRSMEDGLQMLNKGDVHILIDEPDEVELAMKSMGLSKDQYNVIPYVKSQYVYLAFNEGILSERLIDVYNRRVETLMKSGEMQAIYEKWGITVPQALFQIISRR